MHCFYKILRIFANSQSNNELLTVPYAASGHGFSRAADNNLYG